MARGVTKVEENTVATSTTVLVANQHTGHIMFPRKGGDGVSQPPLMLAPGTVTELDKDEWESRKSGKVVQHYLDRGILAEVEKVTSNVPMDETSTDLPIPENLQSEEIQGADATAKVRKDRTRVGSVDV